MNAPRTKRPGSPSELFPLIYGELRRVAGRYLGRERRNHTLQPTALVHEAWLRLRNDRGDEWQGRTHGLALGAQAMRRLLVDHGRHQKREKRGGGAQPVALDDLIKASETGAGPVEDLLTLETALTRLEAVDPRAAQVVTFRFFFGHVIAGSSRTARLVGPDSRKRLGSRAGMAKTGARRRRPGSVNCVRCKVQVHGRGSGVRGSTPSAL